MLQIRRQSVLDVQRIRVPRPLRRRGGDGFKGVEFLFPYDHSAGEIRRRLDDMA